MIDIALNKLAPNASWELFGDNYSGIIWHSDDIPKPTEQEVMTLVSQLKTEYNNNAYQRNRAKEYPDVKEYLDGVVKGDQEQIQAYIDACLAVKAKYPKPE